METETNVEKRRYNLKTAGLRLRNYFSKRNFDTGFEISFFGTMNTTLYTQSEQPRVEVGSQSYSAAKALLTKAFHSDITEQFKNNKTII